MKIHCWYGSGTNTTEQLLYTGDTKSTKPFIIKGDGDGTVNLNSLKVSTDRHEETVLADRNTFQGCLRWKGVKSKEFPGQTHMDMVTGDTVPGYVAKLVSDLNEQIK